MQAMSRDLAERNKKWPRCSMFFSVANIIGCVGFSQAASADQSADFKRDLAQGYSELAKFAEVRTHDSAGQSYFQNKSDRAQALYKVDPEWPTNWSVAPDLQKTMMRDRQTLIAVLTNPKAGHDPKTEAMAQVNFDCWVALSSVAALAPESERCWNAFQAALQQIGVP